MAQKAVRRAGQGGLRATTDVSEVEALAGAVPCGTMARNFPYEAKRQTVALVSTLEVLTKRDPEQEVQGIALPVLDAVIEMVREALPDNPIMAAARSIISAEQIASGEPVRAADALLVAKQLDAAIGHYPPLVA